MSKDEIKALIASSIEGQGNQVDVASKLATILDAIIDNIPESGGGQKAVMLSGAAYEDIAFSGTAQEVCDGLNGNGDFGWTPEVLDSIISKENNGIVAVVCKADVDTEYYFVALLYDHQVDENTGDPSTDYKFSNGDMLVFTKSESEYSVYILGVE